MIVGDLIDDRGRTWGGMSPNLRKHLRTSMQGAAFYRYCICNLGFIGIAHSTTGSVVYLRPAIVSGASRAALCRWLAEQPFNRTAIVSFRGGWKQDIVGSRNAALACLDAMWCADEMVAERFYASNVGLGVLDHPLHRVLEAWRQGGIEAAREACRVTPEVKTVELTGPDPAALKLIWLSDNMLTRARSWRRLALGQPLHTLPDSAYGRWIADGYGDCARSMMPALQHIQADVNWPDGRRLEHRYHRIIIPTPDDGGHVRIFCASLGSDTFGSSVS